MICIQCNKDKPIEEFGEVQGGKKSKRCAECYKKWKSRGDNPKARCEKCEKLFQLDFNPLENKSAIPDRWLCSKCNN